MHVNAHDNAERGPIIYIFVAIPTKGTNGTNGHENVVGVGDSGSAPSNSVDATASNTHIENENNLACQGYR
jgi:hypothetical protein